MDKDMPDMEQFTDNMKAYAEKFQKLASDFLEKQKEHPSSADPDPLNLSGAMMEMTKYFAENPEQIVEKQVNLWKDYMKLWQSTAQKMVGEQNVEPVVRPDKEDRRFKDKDWEENQVFDYIKQSYLLTSKWIEDLVNENPIADSHEGRKLKFFARQFIDAISPTNFAMTNPEVIRETIEKNGKNLLAGLENIAKDINPETGEFRIRMTDETAFEPGRNVASTPGKVVYQNELIQLIQYEPTTEKVYKTPILVTPPWINKFYILDLRPENSLIRWLVEKGYTVFVISWKNPDKSMAELDFDDYMTLGPLSALGAIEDATGEKSVNAIGYCIGGTLLACTLAFLGAKNSIDRVKSATFLVTQVDFSESGELQLFVDQRQLAAMEKMMMEKGYLDGSTMAQTFNMLRSNDLIWSFVINNYLLGRDPFPFDLLYWNSDSTRLTRACHTQYLKEMYLENNLVKPGKLVLHDTPIDLSNITIPTYIQAAQTDHICPWKSVYKATQQFSGKRRFMLAGSGHIAGVVNPPSAKKYNHWVNKETPESPDVWLEQSEEHPGSWWSDWHKWLKGKSGKKVPARIPGDGKLDVIEDAPGSYVKIRY
ncbi:PHA/PHB synthase family protein [Emcibacter sp.]|uniref:PHA/PHB synthase family protein n=1 Tax=Emcibacter sp. TaxID=1979954 RepID=UPI003A9351F4